MASCVLRGIQQLQHTRSRTDQSSAITTFLRNTRTLNFESHETAESVPRLARDFIEGQSFTFVWDRLKATSSPLLATRKRPLLLLPIPHCCLECLAHLVRVLARIGASGRSPMGFLPDTDQGTTNGKAGQRKPHNRAPLPGEKPDQSQQSAMDIIGQVPTHNLRQTWFDLLCLRSCKPGKQAGIIEHKSQTHTHTRHDYALPLGCAQLLFMQ